MELRQQTAPPLVTSGPRAGRFDRHPRRRRLLARIRSRGLDEALAAAKDPDSDPLLATRADQLLSPGVRRRLAEGLREVVERAVFPAAPSAAAPLASESIRADSGLILALAARLDSDQPVEACGVARAELLLTDGASPLYAPGNPLSLQGGLESALIGLGG